MHFHIYYEFQESGEHLRQCVTSAGVGTVAAARHLQHLPPQWGGGAAVVLLEYQEGNPVLDSWITHHAADPRGPAIFLYFREISPENIWKTLDLGVHGYVTHPLLEQELQESLVAVGRMEP